jgi:hypothetical protein
MAYKDTYGHNPCFPRRVRPSSSTRAYIRQCPGPMDRSAREPLSLVWLAYYTRKALMVKMNFTFDSSQGGAVTRVQWKPDEEQSDAILGFGYSLI